MEQGGNNTKYTIYRFDVLLYYLYLLFATKVNFHLTHTQTHLDISVM